MWNSFIMCLVKNETLLQLRLSLIFNFVLPSLVYAFIAEWSNTFSYTFQWLPRIPLISDTHLLFYLGFFLQFRYQRVNYLYDTCLQMHNRETSNVMPKRELAILNAYVLHVTIDWNIDVPSLWKMSHAKLRNPLKYYANALLV